MDTKLPFEIIYAEEMDKDHLKQALKILDDHAANARGLEPIKEFSFAMIDENKNVIAGVNGVSLYGVIYVSLLSVNENFRGQNYGTLLMQKVEKLALERKCTMITLATMDFQAMPFYEKLGYKIEFERSGYSKNSIMYHLRKDL